MESFLRGRTREKVVSVEPPTPPSPFVRRQTAPDSGAGDRDLHFGMDPAPGHAAHGEPRVELLCEDGRVSRIIVTCTCGQRIELECTYG